MKLLFDFFPILLFFLVFKLYGFYAATASAIVAYFVQIGAFYIKNRQIEFIHKIILVIMVVLGGATLLLHNELFFKWKPTVINWVFAILFLGSHWIGEKPIIQRMMENNIVLPEYIWSRLNFLWVLFFIVIGTANLYVAYHFDTQTWVNFKLFGVLGCTIVFVIFQSIYLSKHVDPKGIGKL